MRRPLSQELQSLASQLMPTIYRLGVRFRRRHPSVALEDLVSVGNEASVIAASRYDRERGPYEPFAFKYVEAAMEELVRRTKQLHTREQALIRGLDFAMQSPFDFLFGRTDSLEAEQKAAVRDARLRVTGLLVALHTYSANDAEDEFLEQRALTIGRAVIEETSDGFGEPERTFFVRHFREGRTLVQIASELGLSRKAARVLGDRVKERLAEALRSARVA